METKPQRIALSMQEDAEAVALSRRKLDQLVSDGTLRTVKIGARRLVPRAELERLFRLDRQEAAA